MDDNLRRVAKAIQFGVLYGAGPDRIATMIERSRKETRDMKQKRMIKHRGRIKLKPEQVFHFGKSGSANYACFVCGAPAMHQVRAINDGSTGYKQGDLYLCTHHFVQMFSLPPNRHPKVQWVGGKRPVPKPKVDENGNGDIVLRRFMNEPLRFLGHRVICHKVEIAHTVWYFSLYWNRDDEKNVVTTTRIVNNKRGKMAINLAKQLSGGLDGVVVTVLKQLQTMDEFLPFEKEGLNEHIRVQEAATDFITMCLDEEL